MGSIYLRETDVKVVRPIDVKMVRPMKSIYLRETDKDTYDNGCWKENSYTK